MISQYKLKGEKLQVRRYFNTFPGYAIAQDRVRVKLRPHLRCFPQAVPTRHRAEKQFQYVLKKENLKKKRVHCTRLYMHVPARIVLILAAAARPGQKKTT